MVFIKAKSNGEDLKRVDDMRLGLDFSHDLGEGFNDAYFLIDEKQDIEFYITTPSSDVYQVSKTNLGIENDREIIPEMKELVSKYEKSVNLLTPLEPYVEGKVLDIAQTKDGSMVMSPLTENMTIKYVFPNGKKYLTNTEGLFPSNSEITWENGKIVSFIYQ
ncbi:hypothetical protein [Bernardetia sp.]|uniref:hypothetical protein n=1 Tax=Bernardetia sp. TaxID=1937974 RepID=UPI0025C01DA1|nr:hypothetical protein [Bernardetia sp.]